MSFLLLAIDKAPLAADASTEMKSVIDLSAVNRPSATDEVARRCSNYAISTLASAIEVAAYELSPGLVKGIIATAKLSASVFTSRAHVKVESKVEETSFVDIVIEAIWTAIRADVNLLAQAPVRLSEGSPEHQFSLLTQVGPLWPVGKPNWSVPD